INPIRWLHHSLFFIAGLGWHSGRTRLPALTRGPLPWLFLAGSAVALVVRVRWLPLDLAASLTGLAAWASVASASLFGWLTLYGSLGVCAHLARYGGRAIKYLADSSYWVYLVHFPVVGLVQADLFLVALPSPVKFLVALAIGLAWSLLTYEACVRRTWIGRWLRGGAPRVPSVPRPGYFERDEVPSVWGAGTWEKGGAGRGVTPRGVRSPQEGGCAVPWKSPPVPKQRPALAHAAPPAARSAAEAARRLGVSR